jgi:hypothetical protein
MVTITLHCAHCGSDARVARWACHRRQTELSLSGLRPSQPRESDSHRLPRSSSRGESACLSRTQQFALLPRHHQQSHTPPDGHCASQDRDAAIKDDPAQPDDHAGEVHRIARELVGATHHQLVLGALHLKGAT